ncbi:hypothetical protein REPUB_Repub02eG0189400 [Reevesia pubescens]
MQLRKKLKIDCIHNTTVMELLRSVRTQLTELIYGLSAQDLAPMSLGLSHSLSRSKLKFSADRVDTMIVQAIDLFDDLNKELNTYAMRIRECSISSEILPEEVEIDLKEAAVISMGIEVNAFDLMNIKELCDQVISLAENRAQLHDYSKSRINTVAPNLTALVGELMGTRLIAHGGNLLNLAKQPGNTVQILGAEKALFRALGLSIQLPNTGLFTMHLWLVRQHQNTRGRFSGHSLQRLHLSA